jgi:hypothetical protein
MHRTHLELGNEVGMYGYEHNKTKLSWPEVVFIVLMVIGICFVAWLNIWGMR